MSGMFSQIMVLQQCFNLTFEWQVQHWAFCAMLFGVYHIKTLLESNLIGNVFFFFW